MAGPAASGATKDQVLSAAHFTIEIEGTVVATFSELTGINSEVEAVEYIAVKDGHVVHSKQFGKTKPPKVSLKRGMDKEGTHNLWAWHQAVLDGDPGALRTCELTLKTSSGEISLSYVLEDAWPAKIDVAGAKAGSSDVITQTVEMVCSQIYMP
jgi:phage tail-like protein